MTQGALGKAPPSRQSILGVVLAGGQSQRMGAEKALMSLAGRPLVVNAIERLRPQVGRVILNANGDAARFGSLGIEVVADPIAGYPGPLAGMLAAMRWASAHAREVTHVATVPVDTPFFPADMIDRLGQGLVAGARLSYAATPAGPEPVFALAEVTLADALERSIVSGAARKVIGWFATEAHVAVQFEDADAFFNLNTPADLKRAEGMRRDR